MMTNKERNFITLILSSILLMVLVDLITDSREGVVWWHVAIEGAMGLAAGTGIFFILRDSARIKSTLETERKEFSHFKHEAEKWKVQSRKYIEGLSQAIDDQLSMWNLSASEKEVALLLLKGLSLKEVADIRNTSEKTARTQSMAIYSKSGLSGRSELAAFFLEDLLTPSSRFTIDNLN